MHLQSIEERLKTGWPTIGEIEAGNVYRPDLVDTLLGYLESNRFAMLFAPEGRGKSTLARILAVEARKTRKVLFLNCAESPTQELHELSTAIHNSDRATTKPLWIIDDSHLASSELQNISDAFEEAIHSRFLFVARYENDWPVDDFIESPGTFELEVADDVIRAIVDLYISSRGLDDRFVGGVPLSRDDYNNAERVSGGNLRALKLILDEWDPRATPLSTLSAAGVARKVSKQVLQPLAKEHGRDLVETFALISTFSKWGLALPVASLDPVSVQQLVALGYIARIDDAPPSVKSPHAADGRFYQSAYAYWRGCEVAAVDSDAARRIPSLIKKPAQLRVLFKTLSAERRRLLEFETASELLATLAPTLSARGVRTAAALANVTAEAQIARHIIDFFGTDELITFLKRAGNDDARTILSALRYHDEVVTTSLQDALTLEDRVRQYAADNLRPIAKALKYYHDAGSAHFATLLLSHLLSTDLRIKIPRSGLGSCSRFMNAANQIDLSLAAEAAPIFAELVHLEAGPNLAQLSQLLGALRTHPSSSVRLIERFFESCLPLEALIQVSFTCFCHLMSFLSVAAQDDAERARLVPLFLQWENMASPALVSAVTGEAIQRLLQAYAMGRRSSASWVISSASVLADHVKNSDQKVRFFLAWQLWQSAPSSFSLVLDRLTNSEHRIPVHVDGAFDLSFDGLLTARGYDTEVMDTAVLELRLEEFRQLWPRPTVAWLMAAWSLLRRYPGPGILSLIEVHRNYLVTAVSNRSADTFGAIEMARVATMILELVDKSTGFQTPPT